MPSTCPKVSNQMSATLERDNYPPSPSPSITISSHPGGCHLRADGFYNYLMLHGGCHMRADGFYKDLVLHGAFLHHSTQNSSFPILIHSLIHIDLTGNGGHRFEPLPRSHVPICLGGALIATCNPGRRLQHGLDREHDV